MLLEICQTEQEAAKHSVDAVDPVSVTVFVLDEQAAIGSRCPHRAEWRSYLQPCTLSFEGHSHRTTERCVHASDNCEIRLLKLKLAGAAPSKLASGLEVHGPKVTGTAQSQPRTAC